MKDSLECEYLNYLRVFCSLPAMVKFVSDNALEQTVAGVESSPYVAIMKALPALFSADDIDAVSIPQG